MAMRQMIRFVTAAAALIVATSPGALTTGTATATPSDRSAESGGTFLPFSGVLRRCDFSANMHSAPTGYGRATAHIRTTDSSQVVADVHLVTALPNTHYDVRLIQLPRPSSSTCNAGDPGTVAGALNTDASGDANATLQTGIASGATSAWVFISRPSAFSQTPAEYYSTDHPAAI